MEALSKSAFFSAILSAEWSGKAIVIILFLLSIFALAVFIKKIKDFRKINYLNREFLSSFRRTRSLEEFYKESSKFKGPMARLFEEGYNSQQQDVSALINELVLKEKQGFESLLVFLATTVTISPFLGLLGTVWGIMVTFMDIRNYGSAHINIVAPGIAESLITTVMGLLVAVPVLVFYNYSTNKSNSLSDEIEVFSKELIDRLNLRTLQNKGL